MFSVHLYTVNYSYSMCRNGKRRPISALPADCVQRSCVMVRSEKRDVRGDVVILHHRVVDTSFNAKSLKYGAKELEPTPLRSY